MLECPRRGSIFAADQGPGPLDLGLPQLGAREGQQGGSHPPAPRPGRHEDIVHIAACRGRTDLAVELGDENWTTRTPQDGGRLAIEIGTHGQIAACPFLTAIGLGQLERQAQRPAASRRQGIELARLKARKRQPRRRRDVGGVQLAALQ